MRLLHRLLVFIIINNLYIWRRPLKLLILLHYHLLFSFDSFYSFIFNHLKFWIYCYILLSCIWVVIDSHIRFSFRVCWTENIVINYWFRMTHAWFMTVFHGIINIWDVDITSIFETWLICKGTICMYAASFPAENIVNRLTFWE